MSGIGIEIRIGAGMAAGAGAAPDGGAPPADRRTDTIVDPPFHGTAPAAFTTSTEDTTCAE